MKSLAFPVILGLLLSFLIDRQIRPSTSLPWKRSFSSLCIHAGLWLFFFTLELLLFRRPWMAAAGVSVAFYVLVVISNAKYNVLREPFVYQDFDYFIDVLSHPRLYLPFLEIRRIILVVIAVVSALFLGITVEQPLTREGHSFVFAVLAFACFSVALLLIRFGHKSRYTLAFDPQIDVSQYGFLTSLWAYAIAERSHVSIPLIQNTENLSSAAACKLPTVVVVQSESFFDVRTLYPGIRRDVLSEYDLLKKSAVLHGKLKVPAWGANTVRSEFSFLSGLAPDVLGVHRFNPYRKLVRQGFPTLASHLRALGYHTVCVHPYPATFYGRNHVFPKLGFDQFFDIDSFNRPDNGEPFVNDVVLAEKVISILSDSTAKPVFIFVITMENHGPLHLEKVDIRDEERFYVTPPPSSCEDLTVYLRHLSNANCMAGLLRDRLGALFKPALLCWFGDHVPIMPKVYAALGMPSGETDYLIWSTDGKSECLFERDIKIENLNRLLLHQIGLAKKEILK